MDAPESCDALRHLPGTAWRRLPDRRNRGSDTWLATFADPLRPQSAIDRFTSRAYDLVIEGESYRI